MKRRDIKLPILKPALMDDLYIIYKGLLKPFGRNIRALRLYCGLSTVFVVKDLMTKYNFLTSRETIQLLERNQPDQFHPVSIFYLLFIAHYWQIPLNSLLTEDFTIEANLPEHIRVRKKFNKAVIASNNRVDRPIERRLPHSFTYSNPSLNQLPSIRP